MNQSVKKRPFCFFMTVVSVLSLMLFAAACSQTTVNTDVSVEPAVVSENSVPTDAESSSGEIIAANQAVISDSTAATVAPSEDEFSEFDEFEDEFGDATKIEVFDPLEGYNRVMTTINDKLYFWVLKPVAQCYRWIVPECVRRGVDRFFTNLLYPIRLVNNVLQLKFKNAGEETLRFVTNTTVGVLGFWDPAKEWFGLEAHQEDFGQTLGYYGVGPGPHIVLPFFGPSNLRDALAMYSDTKYLDPKTRYVEGTENQVGVFVYESVNEASLRIGEYESLKKDAVDLYPFLRDGYEQIRIKEIEE